MRLIINPKHLVAKYTYSHPKSKVIIKQVYDFFYTQDIHNTYIFFSLKKFKARYISYELDASRIDTIYIVDD